MRIARRWGVASRASRTVVAADSRAWGSRGICVHILLTQLLSPVLERRSSEGGFNWAMKRRDRTQAEGTAVESHGGRERGIRRDEATWCWRKSWGGGDRPLRQGLMGHVKGFVFFLEAVRSH